MPQSTRFFQTCFGVFQGGGCRAAAFAGAYDEAIRRRVSFAGVAGSSAGSILAALIGAGLSPAELHSALAGLDFRQFTASPSPTDSPWLLRSALPLLKLTPFRDAARVWCYRGLYSSSAIERWLNKLLETHTHVVGRNVRFSDLSIPTWVVATDILSRDVKVWSTWGTPEDEVAYAVRCSCSIPGFFQPVDGRFVDGGVLSNLPAFVFQHAVRAGHSPLATRTLAFTLAAASEGDSPQTTAQAARALIDTVVDGAANVQQRLTDLHLIEIPTGRLKATDFTSITSDAVRTLVDNGRQATGAFFDDELARVRRATAPSSLLHGSDEVYAAVAERLDDSSVSEIWILQDRTRWLYAIYPSLLYWLINGVRVTVVWQSLTDPDSHEKFRRRLLRAMGARIIETNRLPFGAYLFDAGDRVRGMAIVQSEPLVDGAPTMRAVKYIAPLDTAVIEALHDVATGIQGQQQAQGGRPTLIPTTSDELLARLRKYVLPYGQNGVHLEIRRAELGSLVSLSKVVKGFKYQQIGYLRTLFERHGLSPFQLAAVQYANGSSTILTPAVAELSGGQPILIQGNTRALFCDRSEIKEIDCVSVRGVAVPLPSSQRVPVRQMLIGDRTLTTHDRYGSDIDRDYRHIELASHHPDVTLAEGKA